jgi:hypothetical protein
MIAFAVTDLFHTEIHRKPAKNGLAAGVGMRPGASLAARMHACLFLYI